ncbi:MAG: TIGR03086 family protein [Dermatophilaceae bacterium]
MSPLRDLDPAERHRAVSAGFAWVTRGVRSWDGPSPVPEWTARGVVAHLEWIRGFLDGGVGVTLPTGASVEEDPVGSWAAQAAGLQALLDDPDIGERLLRNPHVGELSLAQAVDRFYTSDVFMHTWDLARAAGVDPPLDPDFAAQLLAGMAPMERMLRESGQYGPAHPVDADAALVDRLAAFIGRDPAWRAPELA